MAGYLDAYGAGDERRDRLIKLVLLWAAAILIVAAAFYFTFRNWGEERTVKAFLTRLEQRDYQGAYRMWGCTPDTPCKYYPPEKFNEDWGPSSPFADVAAVKIIHEDSCGNGVVFNVVAPKDENIGLFVDDTTKVISFAPWPRCPGPHLRWPFSKQRSG